MSKFTSPKKLSVVVPVRNEQDNVAPLIAEIDAALKGMMHEIIYVNDGSTDGTQQKVEYLQATYPQLRALLKMAKYGTEWARLRAFYVVVIWRRWVLMGNMYLRFRKTGKS